MGRNTKRPDGYAPLVEFYLRAKPEGGKLLVPGELKGLLDAQSRRECLVLVHGFRNADSEAAEAYFGFRKRQKEIFGAPDITGFDRRFGDTYWPGDADWWLFLDKADFLIYRSAVGTAVEAAQELAGLLRRMTSLERVDFIGHSLGCRVVLETLLLLRARATPAIGRVVLMAAAVPSEMMENGGRLFGLLTELAAQSARIHVLHSKNDLVLHLAFPLGQGSLGGNEASSRALGRFGPSPWMPGFRSTLTERQIAGAGHGDYWGHSKTPPSRTATDNAGKFLSLGDIGRDVGLAREDGVSASPQASRDLGVIRDFGESG
jgi:pimeloyl-ACP methyl ester carboxylesterase